MTDFDSKTICVDLNDDWFVKVVHKTYNNIDYLNIHDYLNVDEIHTVDEIFTKFNELLKESERKIADSNYLYTLNELPQMNWKSSENPYCFESESEYDPHVASDHVPKGISYFDTIIENF